MTQGSERESQRTSIDAIHRLLQEPHLFGGSVADELAPFLERILSTQRLSFEANALLQTLSVATLPLAKPALQVLCPQGSRPLKELRRASVLVAYPDRAQLLPMVAAAMYRRLSTEQVYEQEELLMQAYRAWFEEGTVHEGEKGTLTTAFTVLLLKHHYLLEAGQLLIHYGWLSFNSGYSLYLARLALKIMQDFDWRVTEDNECGGLLIHYRLSPFLGTTIDAKNRFVDYQHIYDAALTGKVILQPASEVAVMYYLMTYAMDETHFEDAQIVLDVCCKRLEPLEVLSIDLQASLLEKRSWLTGTWCEYAVERGEIQKARKLRQQTIAICRESIELLSHMRELSTLKSSFLKKGLARAFNNLAYHLNRLGQHEEALQAIEQSILLKEQGYVEVDTLADAYGEKSQILMELGRFREALYFDEKAITEVQKGIQSQYSYAQKEIWTYLVNRGCLHLRLGRVAEAEQVLQDALPNIRPRRRIYRMFAKEALNEIEQWRHQTTPTHYQLDWRWVERYRLLDAFDSYWWLAPSGPFTQEEQLQWNQHDTKSLDETAKEYLGNIIAQSRERELIIAVEEQREPRLLYPALDIEEVRHRIEAFSLLDAQISREEPNVIVQRFYHGAIEEEMNFLRLIEATYEGDTEKFWHYNLSLNPVPTPEEMSDALAHVRRMLLQGLKLPKTEEVSQQILRFLKERLHLSLDISVEEIDRDEIPQNRPEASDLSLRTLSVQSAKRFFESALHESGYDGWTVEIDPNAVSPRVEQGLQRVFLPEKEMSVERIREYFVHEVAGHVARCVAGEQSLLGLLGINTKNSLETEEGFTLYQERQVAALHGEIYDDVGTWLGTLATGLAAGVTTPPQTFLSLHAFFELFLLLYRLLWRDDEDMQTAQKQARKRAFARCIRTYRGVPSLERAGVCYSKDAHYLRGLKKVEHAVLKDEALLDRLAVGVVALDQLSDLQELGIVAPPSMLRKLAFDPSLDSYIASFEYSSESSKRE